MTRAWYNENDEFAADWLRNLIKAGLIADGEVDTRSIVDVRPRDLVAFEQCHFFAGIGGWSYALRQAGWPDDQPVWTGSCPCQPFSLAGAQRGFADERHLWPVWRDLIRECDPSVVFGEQVASATEWLGLVRGDLEALGYAVGAMPVQAASAGADHLRDRYWFVANAASEGSFPGTQPGVHSGQEGSGAWDGEPKRRGGARSDLADADDAGSQGRGLLPERAGERAAGGVADADNQSGRVEQQQPSGEDTRSRHELGGRSAASDGHVSDAAGEQARSTGQPRERECLDWAIGADGKARRVKPGIRLLAHGVPNRVGLLRGFGNAIDHRPAKEFIKAYMTTRSVSSHNRGHEAT